MDRRPRTGFRPDFDNLDTRRLMAARLTATLAQGVLTVRGTPKADVIVVDAQAGAVFVSGVNKAFNAGRIKRIDVFGGKGDDTILVRSQAIPTRIDGGAGNDTINGVSESAAIPVATTTPRVEAVVIPTVTATPQVPPAPTPTPVVAPPPQASPTPAPAPVALSPSVQRIVDLTNAERIKAGLAPLAVSGPLMGAAEIHSGNMARLHVMSHTLPDADRPTLADRAAAVGYKYSWLGENIAYNYADADAVVAGWMASPGHRANILNASFSEIGVAIAYSANGEPYYTQVFGRRMSA